MNRFELEDVVLMIANARTLLTLKQRHITLSDLTTKELNKLLACDGDYTKEQALLKKWRIV